MAKFCGQCGAPAGDQRFCGSCGAPLHAAPTPAPTPTPAPAPVEPMSDHTAIRPPLEDDGRTVTRPQRAAQAAPQPVQQPAPVQQSAPTQPWPAAPQQPVQQQAPQGWPTQPGGPAAYAPPHAPQQGQQQWGGPSGPVPQAPQRPPRAVPLVNPFLGVPVADFVKDGAAALALLVALGQPWDWSNDANDHWWVVISLLLALVGLGVPYLMASRVVPTFTPQASLVTKLLLAAPLLVSTLVALVMDLTTIGDDETLGGLSPGFEGGLGLAVALGLGGAALMAQPRRHEEATGLLAEQAWRTAGLAAAVAALVVSVATFVAGSIALADSGYVSGATFWTVWIASNLVLPTLFLALPLVALLRGSAGGRRTFAVLAWGVVLVTLVAEPDGSGAVTGSQVEGWATPAGGVWLLGLAGALLLSRPSVRRTQDDEVGGWLTTVQVSLATAAALTLGTAVVLLLVMTMLEMFPGVVIALTLMYLGVAVAAGVAASMGTNLAMRVAVSAAAGLAIVLGVVMWVVVASSDAASIAQAQFTARDVVILFALPALALYALWVPPAVRAQAPRQAPAAAWGQQSYPQQGPGQQGPGQPWSQQGDQPTGQPPAGQWGPPPGQG